MFSQYINLILGIIFLVFCSTLPVTLFSVVRYFTTSACLIPIAFGFTPFLGLCLPLF